MSATDDNRTAKQRKGTAAKLANIVLGVGQFGYATDTKETKVGDGVTTFALLPALGGGALYKKYVAVLSQTGTDDPVARVLENTLGETLTWTRQAQGSYRVLNFGLFSFNKTFCMISQSRDEDNGFAYITWVNEDIILINTFNPSYVLDDQILGLTSVEIRVYP